MTRWTKAILFASIFELPLLIILIAGQARIGQSPFITALTWYHIAPLSLGSLVWLGLFGHGAPSLGSLRIWHTFWWTATFVVQVSVTAPLAFLLVRAVHRNRDSER
jgi:hypothetical protein